LDISTFGLIIIMTLSDEKWLDVRQIAILGPIMSARMDVCKSKGFDAVEPDNMMVYNQVFVFSFHFHLFL
jgi:hypothetical protein